MKQTKLEALKNTRSLWLKIAEKNLEQKPSSAFNVFKCGCPCCDYLVQQADYIFDESCIQHCPMILAWDFKKRQCENENSIYWKWLNVERSYDRQFFAYLIVEWTEYLIKRGE